MDHSPFDALARRVARQSSRRAALAALLGGALLLQSAGASEEADAAADEAGRKAAPATSQRTIAIRVDNTKGTREITVLYGNASENNGCNLITTAKIPAGHHRIFEYLYHGFTTGFVFINAKYWFQFHNPIIGPPFAQIALNGSFLSGSNPQLCCFNDCYLRGIRPGAPVELYREFKAGQTRTYNIENTALFTVRRHSDLKHQKFFTVTPPPTL